MAEATEQLGGDDVSGSSQKSLRFDFDGKKILKSCGVEDKVRLAVLYGKDPVGSGIREVG